MLCNFGFVRWLYTRNSLLKILRKHEIRIDQLNCENAGLRATAVGTWEHVWVE